MTSRFTAMEAVNYSTDHRGTLYVLAIDYAAIVAELDEWKRRCEAILVAVAKEEGGNNHDFHPCNFVCREIRAIAEGRDNG